MTVLATWNVGSGPDDRKARGLASLVKAGVDVLGLQECGDRRGLLEEFCERAGWHCWVGDKEGSPSTPILWNPEAVKVSRRGTTPATDATYTGRLGAGPNVVKAKVWNHVRVHGDGDPFVFINGHLPASQWAPRRRALARDQVGVLAEMVRRRKGRIDVVTVGDFNCRDDSPVVHELHKAGMSQHTRAATHGRRCIDLVWTLGVAGRAEVVRMPSDHKAVLFTVA